MATNQLGIRNNNTIIPLTASTKRTKEISTVTITAGAYLSSITNMTSKCIFYADSNNVWRMDGTFRFTANLATAAISQFTLDGVIASDTANYQGFASVQIEDLNYTSVGHIAAIASYNTTNTLIEIQYGASVTGESGKSITVTFFGLVLKSEPTTYTTAANMEGVVAVDVFVPNASTTPGLLSYYAEDTTTLATFNWAFNGAPTGNVAGIVTRIGRTVTLMLPEPTAGTSNSSLAYAAGSVALPAAFRPSTNLTFPLGIVSNGTSKAPAGMVLVRTDGVLRLYYDLAGAAWPDAANTYPHSFCASWVV